MIKVFFSRLVKRESRILLSLGRAAYPGLDESILLLIFYNRNKPFLGWLALTVSFRTGQTYICSLRARELSYTIQFHLHTLKDVGRN